MSFEDSDIVRNAVRIEGFRDDEFNYQLIRALGLSAYGGSTVGECLAAATEITDGSPQSWTLAFERLGAGVERRGRSALGRGHRVSGRDHLLRASTYFRTAEYYTEGSGDRPLELGLRSHACFVDAAALFEPPIEVVEIPFEVGSMPGYLVHPAGAGASRPTLIGVGGFDSSAEELYFQLGAPGAERGWNVLVFDGPGQPGCLRRWPEMTFRPDYEVPLGAVIDWVATRPEVDADRIGVAGLSLGSYFAARSAATDARVRALAVDPPIVDMSRYMQAWVGTDTYDMVRDIRPEDVIGVPEDLLPRQMQWGIDAICYRFGVPSFHRWRKAMESYRLGSLIGSIGCPALALIGDREGAEPLAQFEAFVGGVGGPVTAVRFGIEDGTSSHARADNLRLSAQVLFDWLDERLG